MRVSVGNAFILRRCRTVGHEKRPAGRALSLRAPARTL